MVHFLFLFFISLEFPVVDEVFDLPNTTLAASSKTCFNPYIKIKINRKKFF